MTIDQKIISQPNIPPKQSFVKGYECKGAPPLTYFFEEVLVNQKILSKYGLRGESDLFCYSRDGLVGVYYEKGQQQLSAQQFAEFFQSATNRQQYLDNLSNIMLQIKDYVRQVESLDVDRLSLEQTWSWVDRQQALYAEAFALYLASQPHRLKALEDLISLSLRKRIAKVKVGDCLSRLATSSKLSDIALERRDWLKYLKSLRSQIGDKPKLKDELTTNPKFQKQFKEHCRRYRYLTIGDGQWQFNQVYFDNNLVADNQMTKQSIDEELAEIQTRSAKLENEKDRVASRLNLPAKTIELANFLADIGHLRLSYRTQVVIPLIWAWIQISDPLIVNFNLISNPTALEWLNFQEFQSLRKGSNPELIKTAKKRQASGQFLVLLQSGQERFLYGQEAEKAFMKLQPKPPSRSTDNQLQGATAQGGFAKGKACVYKWNDSLDDKLKQMDKHKILITGQTRPTMVPLIRKAQAIVTDEGGITSHAAIISRELGIPCLLNTVHATDFFQDGDLVEVDAGAGVVRRVES